MGTREKLFRQKVAEQLNKLNEEAEIVYSTEGISTEKIDAILHEVHQFLDRLTVYKFLHELPEDESFMVEFLEMKERETASEPPVEVEDTPDIGKIIDEFEEQIAEDTEVVEPDEEDQPEAEKNVDPEPVVEITSTIEIEETELTIEVEPKNDPEPELNEKLRTPDASLAEKLKSKPIKSLVDSIALNERFMYSAELFGGSMEAFNKALRELDHVATFEDARKFIDLQLKSKYNWNEESETAINFITLIERRFV